MTTKPGDPRPGKVNGGYRRAFLDKMRRGLLIRAVRLFTTNVHSYGCFCFFVGG